MYDPSVQWDVIKKEGRAGKMAQCLLLTRENLSLSLGTHIKNLVQWLVHGIPTMGKQIQGETLPHKKGGSGEWLRKTSDIDL